MILPLLLAAAQAAPPAPLDRAGRCLALAQSDPAAGEREASSWAQGGGGAAARQCLGLALANQQRWPGAADAFEAAARAAVAAREPDAAAMHWGQAGNARLAAGDAAKARADLDQALAGTALSGLARGEALLDRARAAVAASDLKAARADLDSAILNAGDDPLVWLLSATLARRMDDVPRAQRDIAEALKRSPDDASVQLEAGNIAAKAGDAAGAKAAWQQAVSAQPGSDAARNASAALAQFDGK